MSKQTMMQKLLRKIGAMCLVALLASCGGGGGGGDDDQSSAPSNSPPTTNTPEQPATSDSSGPSAVPTASNVANTVPVTVQAGSSSQFVPNYPMVTVKVCSPGTGANANCATIDNVLLDSGSYGLRLFASAIPSATLSTLTPQPAAGGGTVAECALFVDSTGWGVVRNADIRMSSEVAQNVPIHVWQDASAADVPTGAPLPCQQNTPLQAVSDLGANGILGVGVASADCPGCVSRADDQFYYACTAGTCTPAQQPLANQVGNPVGRFAQDNNGVIIEMPAVNDNGQATATGTLVFGIDTQANNTLSGTGATLLPTDASGDFSATYNGTALPGFTDSGSNAIFFEDSSLPTSQSNQTFYAPDPTRTLSVSVAGRGVVAPPSTSIPFNVADADKLFRNNNAAFNDLAGSIPGSFDLGMSFFYGRHVYYGITGKTSTGGGTGPYTAFASK